MKVVHSARQNKYILTKNIDNFKYKVTLGYSMITVKCTQLRTESLRNWTRQWNQQLGKVKQWDIKHFLGMAKAYTYSILNQVEDFLEVNLVFYHVKKKIN